MYAAPSTRSPSSGPVQTRGLVNSLVAFYSHGVEARRVSHRSAFIVCKSESEGPPELGGPGALPRFALIVATPLPGALFYF